MLVKMWEYKNTRVACTPIKAANREITGASIANPYSCVLPGDIFWATQNVGGEISWALRTVTQRCVVRAALRIIQLCPLFFPAYFFRAQHIALDSTTAYPADPYRSSPGSLRLVGRGSLWHTRKGEMSPYNASNKESLLL
jgi:hypothetical protein